MSAIGSLQTNVAALEALHGIYIASQTTAGMETQLATGLSVSGPADNPASYIEASGMSMLVNGDSQALSDTSQTVSMIQTAEGGIAQQISILQHLYGIAVQAANGTETSQNRANIQDVAEQYLSAFNGVANTTQYNGISLLDGSVQGMTLKTGATSQDNALLSIQSTAASMLGSSAVTINNKRVWANRTASSSPYGSGSVYIIGQNGMKSGPIHVSALSAAGSLAAQINSYSAETGVTATGTNVQTYKMTPVGSEKWLDGAVSVLAPGEGTAWSPTATSTTGILGGASAVVKQINKSMASAAHPLTATLTGPSSFTVTQASGYNYQWGIGKSATLSTGSGEDVPEGSTTGMIFGTLNLKSTGSYSIVNGSLIGLPGPRHPAARLSNINLSTASGAEDAMTVIQAAMTQLGRIGGNLGAAQEGFQADANNLTAQGTNAAVALGAVQDANIPAVSNSLTEAQIRSQAGVAALAQSTKLQQAFLSLLP